MNEQEKQDDVETHEIPDFEEGEPAFEPGKPAGEPDSLESLRTEKEAIEQRLLRVSADYQNYVKRSQQNERSALDQQLMSLARDLVVVMDHFDRAVEVDPEQVSAQSVLDGVRIVHDELLRTLSKYGIERLEAVVGEPFDPNRHEAMMRSAVEGLEPNQVAVQLQPGYALRDKTIRPAGVSVSE